MGTFRIDVKDLCWIDDSPDDPQDQCAHGLATAVIGERTLTYFATVSSTALYLLKTLTENHEIEVDDNQMLPCCGFFIIPSEDLMTALPIGCVYGIDWSVIHEGENVRLILEDGYETIVPIDAYREEVYRFVDKVEDFYNACTPKEIPVNEFDRRGITAFWNEWHWRRGERNA